MKDMRNSRIKILFVLLMAAVVVIYVYLIAPYFLDKVDSLITDNKQMEYDLKELENMGNDTGTISKNIETSKNQLEEFEKRTEVDGTSYDMDISKKADKADIEITEKIVEEAITVNNKEQTGSTLILQPVTISFTGNFADGIEFIKSLEKSVTGIYKVQDFLYSKGSNDEGKNWMLGIDVYYYE